MLQYGSEKISGSGLFTYRGGKNMDLFKPTYIIIHHSLTKDSKTVSWQAIRNYHVNTLGWQEIGYHYGIELVNDQHEILVGRMEGTQGAHCVQKRINHKSIGICCIGNYDNDLPNLAIWSMLLDLCTNICVRYDIPAGNVKGHREYASYKSCPGNAFNMVDLRNDLEAYLLNE